MWFIFLLFLLITFSGLSVLRVQWYIDGLGIVIDSSSLNIWRDTQIKVTFSHVASYFFLILYPFLFTNKRIVFSTPFPIPTCHLKKSKDLCYSHHFSGKGNEQVGSCMHQSFHKFLIKLTMLYSRLFTNNAIGMQLYIAWIKYHIFPNNISINMTQWFRTRQFYILTISIVLFIITKVLSLSRSRAASKIILYRTTNISSWFHSNQLRCIGVDKWVLNEKGAKPPYTHLDIQKKKENVTFFLETFFDGIKEIWIIVREDVWAPLVVSS